MNAREHESGRRLLERAYDGLEAQAPDRATRAIRWLRSPRSRWVRLPLGLVLIASSFFFYLPVIGLWFLPLGLLVVAQDVPFLRKPVARMMLWLEHKWAAFRARSQPEGSRAGKQDSHASAREDERG